MPSIALILIFLGAMNDAVLWTSLEPNFGTISACLPTLKPLITWLFSKVPTHVKSAGHRSAERPGYIFSHAKRRGRKLAYSLGVATDNDRFHTLVDHNLQDPSKDLTMQKMSSVSTVSYDVDGGLQEEAGHLPS